MIPQFGSFSYKNKACTTPACTILWACLFIFYSRRYNCTTKFNFSNLKEGPSSLDDLQYTWVDLQLNQGRTWSYHDLSQIRIRLFLVCCWLLPWCTFGCPNSWLQILFSPSWNMNLILLREIKNKLRIVIRSIFLQGTRFAFKCFAKVLQMFPCYQAGAKYGFPNIICWLFVNWPCCTLLVYCILICHMNSCVFCSGLLVIKTWLRKITRLSGCHFDCLDRTDEQKLGTRTWILCDCNGQASQVICITKRRFQTLVGKMKMMRAQELSVPRL